MSSFSVLVHVAGVTFVSLLILTSRSQNDFYHSVNSNATGVLHDAFDRFEEVLSVFLPGGDALVCPGTLLQILVYLAVAVYVSYLLKLAIV